MYVKMRARLSIVFYLFQTEGFNTKLHKDLTSAINKPPLFAYRNCCFHMHEHNGNFQLTHFNVHFNAHFNVHFNVSKNDLNYCTIFVIVIFQ